MCQRSFFQDRVRQRTFEQLAGSDFLRGFLNERNSDPPSILSMSLSHKLWRKVSGVEVIKIVFQERLSERICEQDDVIKVSTISSEDRMLQLNQILDAEQTVDVPVFRVFFQDRIRLRLVEQNIENPVDESIS